MAAALALVAIMARWPTPVHNRQVRHTVRHHHPAELFADHVARQHAAARKVQDRKSTRLNSSHGYISYAVFCLKKKKKHILFTFCLLHCAFEFDLTYNAAWILYH